MQNLILIHLMIGPVILGLSILYKYYPDLRIAFGKQEIRNRETAIWKEAVRYSGKAMIYASLSTMVFQTICLVSLSPLTSIWASTIFLAACLLIILPLTEIHLRKKYWYKD